ncbi:MAG: hypothetical protein ACLSAH_05890 [Bilophila wadsworthia]
MVFVLSSSSTLVEPLFTPIIIEHVGGAGRTILRHGVHAAAMRRVMSAAISLSRQSTGAWSCRRGWRRPCRVFDDLGHAFRDHVHGLRVGDALPLAVFLRRMGSVMR